MATNLSIDQRLLEEAQSLGKIKTKKETVNKALEEFIYRRKQASLKKLFNSLIWTKSFDYKKERNRD